MDALGNYSSGSIEPLSIAFKGLTPPQGFGRQLPVSLSVADTFSRQANSQSVVAGGNDEQGSLSTGKKINLFLKGLISPLTEPFKSVKGFLTAASVFIAHAVLIGATGGAAAVPMLVLAGMTGGYHLVKSIIALNQAHSSSDQEKAIKNLGAGVGNLALVGFGAKTALREGTSISSETINKMSLPKALKENVKQTPESLRNSKTALQGGNVVENTRLYLSRQMTEARDKIQITHSQIKTQWADKEIPWQDRVKSIANGLGRSLSFTSLLGIQ
jgi:hypothetical protein